MRLYDLTFQMMLAAAVSLTCVGQASAALLEVRTIDGSGNNVVNPTWGKVDEQLLRDAPSAYDDGISEPRGGDPSTMPSARAVSNAASPQIGNLFNNRQLSSMVWQWGQFVDHDIDLTENASPAEPFDINVPTGDPFFDPGSTGAEVIDLNRSVFDPTTGTGVGNPRQQINQISAYIDASNVYGSDAVRAAALRTGVDGKLDSQIVSGEELLPFNTGGLSNAGGPDPTLFLAGDVRANEQIGLTAMHTLFVREHNRLAEVIKANDPLLSDEDIYQKARKIVDAQIQSITYNEFLPALLGSAAGSLDPSFASYDDTINAQISNEFSTATYRFGHSMLAPDLLLGTNGAAGEVPLRDAFFDPTLLSGSPGNFDLLLQGLVSQQSQEVDTLLVDDVRNFLFGPPGSGGFDLASLNIQRGRDHGLSDYNTVRLAMGLDAATDFFDPDGAGGIVGITTDAALAAALDSVYGSDISEVDLWIGALAEDHLLGSSVGELLATSLVDQFTRLRDGDRFFYTFDPDLEHPDILEVLDELYGTTDISEVRLSDVMLGNTNISNLQENVFFTATAAPEPSTFALGLLGLLMLGCCGRRRRRR